MKDDVIPLIWDSGTVGSVAVDRHGMLHLRHAIDDELARELEITKEALGLPNVGPPFHVAPSIVGAADVAALMNELVLHRR